MIPTRTKKPINIDDYRDTTPTVSTNVQLDKDSLYSELRQTLSPISVDSFISPKSEIHGIIDVKKEESDNMSEEKFVTKNEIEHLQEMTDLKIQSMTNLLNSKMDASNNKLDYLSSSLNDKMENMTNSFDLKLDKAVLELAKVISESASAEEKERKKEKRESTRTILTGMSVIVAIAGLIAKLIFG